MVLPGMRLFAGLPSTPARESTECLGHEPTRSPDPTVPRLWDGFSRHFRGSGTLSAEDICASSLDTRALCGGSGVRNREESPDVSLFAARAGGAARAALMRTGALQRCSTAGGNFKPPAANYLSCGSPHRPRKPEKCGGW